ncbi:helix-turn-helix domain-containing protein [Paenibacillus radicis (ex Xue et al. 2023)]|uniref:Helix-turn-helix domain-containing protein n=1 Tax=Paenibacillus radicis (ex Xue et al. 2023) TaxID=2972489 RepID=A0ABT1Y9X8_9BACL|nr:helix-turn-helix domain-containing protein [Paenibacillus radicis (ex Xue et al. 2023)]MCR8629993.1 helix-turn-helix domain-containing protein [Paenibacillus radicis (ex Xue et al. 2023)]
MFKNRWFNRMLLSYLPVFLIMTVLLMTLSFLSLSMVSKRMTLTINEAYTNYAMDVVDQSLRSIDQLLYKEIETNSKLKQFFFNSLWDNTYYTIREPSQKMVEIITTVPMIDSMYLFRIHDRRILSQNMESPLEQFGDKEFIQSMISENFPEHWTSIRTFREFEGEQKSKSVVSLVKRVPQISGGQGMIVVNINTDEIEKLISGISNSETVYFQLFDQLGKPLTGGSADQALMTELSEGKELARVRSAYTGWEVGSGVRNRGQLDFVNSLTYVAIFAGIGVLLAGIGWIIIVTRRNYRPIESIMSRVQVYSNQKQNNGGTVQKKANDEFKMIESAMDQMIEQFNEYTLQQEKYLTVKRQEDFRYLLEQSQASEAEDGRFALAIEPYRAWRGAAAVIIEMDKEFSFNQAYSTQDKSLLKFSLLKATKEIAEDRSWTLWAEWLSESRLGCIYFSNEEAHECLDQCEQLQEILRCWVSENLSFTVTIAIGPYAANLSNIQGSYAAAREALSYKATLGSNRLIRQNEINEGEGHQEEVYDHLQMIRSIVQLFQVGEEWTERFLALFNKLRAGMFSNDEFRSLADYVHYHLHKEMLKLPDEFRAAWESIHLPELKDLLERCETFDELQTELYRFLQQVQTELNSFRESGSKYALIPKIRAYIDEHYDDPNLSLEQLGGTFGVTAKYISQIFKEGYGQKFVDYLANVRIEKAKQLLEQTDKTLQEIGIEVSYIHLYSFTRVFKKVVGMTPGEYRKNVSRK